jgi:hypothetical protein
MATPPTFAVGQVLTSATMNQVGMWKLETVSFNATTFQFTDGIITTDFNIYKIFISTTSVQNTNALLRLTLRASGSAITGTNVYRFTRINSDALAFNNSTGQSNTELEFCRTGDAGSASSRAFLAEATLYNLATIDPKRGFSDCAHGTNAGDSMQRRYGLQFNITTAADGISFSSSTGTMTGTASLYGINQ